MIATPIKNKQVPLLRRILRRQERPYRPGPRGYIPASLGVKAFFQSLGELGARYVVLRWFEKLPQVDPGEDLDILVCDEDLGKVRALLDGDRTGIPCDVYSVSGLPGSDFRGVAYYPPSAAEGILERARIHNDFYRVPGPEDHFRSLAFHALYHKGAECGLPNEAAIAPSGNPEHDYVGVLRGLAEELGIDIPLTMEGLDMFLASVGWKPTTDCLAKLATRNAWLRTRISEHRDEAMNSAYRGLVVFLIREGAVKMGVSGSIIQQLEAGGFNLLMVKELDKATRNAAKEQTRGGNWYRGPWPISGGDPAIAVVAVDLLPVAPSEAQKERFPLLDNGHILVKHRIRDVLNAAVPENQQCNLIHSSDNGLEALGYLDIVAPELRSSLQDKLEELRRSLASQYPVIKDLTKRGRRAKVELIEYRGHLAVKKTFKPGFERFLYREKQALKVLKGIRQEVPELLEEGPNYVIIPYYENHLNPSKRSLLPLWVTHQAFEFVNAVYSTGYTLIDFGPHNLVLDPKHGLKVVDFEFFQEYGSPHPSRVESAYELAGVPSDAQLEVPNGYAQDPYKAYWYRRVGLDLKSLSHDPLLQQHVKRSIYRVKAVGRAAGGSALRAMTKGFRKGVRYGRRAARRVRAVGHRNGEK